MLPPVVICEKVTAKFVAINRHSTALTHIYAHPLTPLTCFHLCVEGPSIPPMPTFPGSKSTERKRNEMSDELANIMVSHCRNLTIDTMLVIGLADPEFSPLFHGHCRNLTIDTMLVIGLAG